MDYQLPKTDRAWWQRDWVLGGMIVFGMVLSLAPVVLICGSLAFKMYGLLQSQVALERSELELMRAEIELHELRQRYAAELEATRKLINEVQHGDEQ